MMDPSLQLSPADEHNRHLIANVRPPGWQNPDPEGRYNLVVVGAGTAGLVAAAGAAGLGARVALVERHLMGGDCLNIGCVPSKAIIRSARAAHEIRSAGLLGVRANGVAIDFAAAMERLRAVRAEISPHDSARRFSEHYGVDVYFGNARFTAGDEVEVDGTILKFWRALIATGARAAVPPVPGLEEAGYLTNATVFNLTERPARLAVIGGGPIGCELAQAFVRLGSEVVVVEMSDRLLAREDRDATAVLESSLARDGVDIRLSTRLESVERSADGTILVLESGDGLDRLTVDQILVGVGRTPNVEGLGLEAAGVAWDSAGITVDDTLRTTNPKIYASGDVCLPHKFTHSADAASRLVLQNALFPGPKQRLGNLVVPRCTYTDPEIAHVGLTPEAAAERGLAIDTWRIDMAEVDRALADGDSEGFVKIHCRKDRDTIVGATVVAVHAGEIISEITTALVHGVGLGKLSNVIHPYPTRAEAIRKAADAYNRTRLTPLVKKIMESWFRWTR